MSIAGWLKRNWRRGLVVLTVLVIALLVTVELVARFYFGLGDPPLSMVDDQTQYRFVPGTYHRFGNLVHINQYSMRSEEVTPRKQDPREFRVLLLGDSVINGGVLTDQADIASSMLDRELDQPLGRSVRVLNVSTGSWGPWNVRGYLQKFGTFDADLAMLVISSHDLVDVPKPGENPVGSLPFPDRKPVSAAWEGYTRYFQPRLDVWLNGPAQRAPAPSPESEALAEGSAALRDLLQLLKEEGIRTVVVVHPQLDELHGKPIVERARLLDLLRASAAEVLDLAPVFRAHGSFDSLYRDNIHINDAGQRVLADTLKPLIRDAAGTPTNVRP